MLYSIYNNPNNHNRHLSSHQKPANYHRHRHTFPLLPQTPRKQMHHDQNKKHHLPQAPTFIRSHHDANTITRVTAAHSDAAAVSHAAIHLHADIGANTHAEQHFVQTTQKAPTTAFTQIWTQTTIVQTIEVHQTQRARGAPPTNSACHVEKQISSRPFYSHTTYREQMAMALIGHLTSDKTQASTTLLNRAAICTISSHGQTADIAGPIAVQPLDMPLADNRLPHHKNVAPLHHRHAVPYHHDTHIHNVTVMKKKQNSLRHPFPDNPSSMTYQQAASYHHHTNKHLPPSKDFGVMPKFFCQLRDSESLLRL